MHIGCTAHAYAVCGNCPWPVPWLQSVRSQESHKQEPLMTNQSDRDVLEYLRVYVMVWQKIDFIWGMFLTTYLPLLGFINFYQKDISPVFAVLMTLAVGLFTLINGRSLRAHYDIANTMSAEFRRLNRSYPDLNGALGRRANVMKPGIVAVTHVLAFAGFVYLVAGRLLPGVCGTDTGWGCIGRMLWGH